MSSPLQNRVSPEGALFAVEARGGMFGNRGGRIHDDNRKIVRNWASKQWICCVLQFKGRQRTIMGNSYTELFFLDEATALAAGHRPCFECRRREAVAFAELWADAKGMPVRARAPDMDKILHSERLGPRETVDFSDLPSGAMFQSGKDSYLKVAGGARRWSFDGYGPKTPGSGPIEALTCRSIREVLAAGYAPQLHPSAA